ncbi:Tyrosine--tRNA ligase [Rosistilla carotiformis]|uniref:Tyrosine--tRNA ligase n=1 Tax=Rosistilla carotiformis TaxID=2528017 RepID=A0A518K156_9BACT|nr:tyrosine--tRNA ligase [Rosistilla carotiformis]QDV71526.1 Tyrosine--tRNA ligase [Rosistilla carotiformis]
MTDILSELRWRNLIHQVTDEAGLAKLLSEGSQSVYAGFDPTADSLHVGSLLPLMMLRRFQRAGHRPVALVGGATGMIGDPSGKSEERNLLSADQLEKNVAGIASQVQSFLDSDGDNAAQLVNNFDWMKNFSYLNFLRDVGKNFPVGVMMGKESVKSRLTSEAGLSYTEFSYMLLQAYDFVELNKKLGCRVQLGGSDQWGNITAGIDLGRRMGTPQLYGMTSPLLLTSDGRKMGKTERGTIWLSAERTSPYEFFQYWRNVDDKDVMTCLHYLTEIDREECESLAQELENNAGAAVAQKRLAEWLTQLVHGDAGLKSALNASQILFGGEISDLSDKELTQIFADVPSKELPKSSLEGEGLWVVEAFKTSGLVSSNGEARRAVQEGSAYINNQRQQDIDYKLTRADLASESVMVLRRGKKKYALLRFV